MLKLSSYLIAACLICVSQEGSQANPAQLEAFYKDRRITMYVGSATGGGYDAYARLVARYLPNYIPGRPNFVVSNMPGAGGIVAANHFYKVAPQDGTAISSFQRELLTLPLLEPDMKVEYDPLKLQWLGSLNADTGVVVASTSSSAKTMQDVFKSELIVGSTGPASDYLAIAMNNVIGTKFKIVTGYKSPNDIYFAMEQGEIDGRISQGWTGDRAMLQPLYEAGKVRFLSVIGLERSPLFPGIPLVTEFAKEDRERKILELILVSQQWGRPFAYGQQVALDKVQMMKVAFKSLLSDRTFAEEAKTLGLDLEFMSGEAMSDLLKKVYNTEADILAAARKAIR